MMTEVHEYLERLTTLIASTGCVPRPGHAYASTMEFVLEHGVEFPIAVEQPKDRWQMKQCFRNSYLYAIETGLRYCEGYAVAKGVPLPVHHAWNLNALGEVVDVTWGDTGETYVGMAFSMKRTADALTNGTGSVLDDWQRHHPILRERWQGEEAR